MQKSFYSKKVKMKYIKPEVYSNSFTCPHCSTITKQNWWSRKWNDTESHHRSDNPIRIGTCHHCLTSTLWIDNNMYFPDSGNTLTPNTEMPDPVKKLYLEAASIHNKSPRGAAALLRLSIQVLCKELGEEGKNINTDIKNLVKKGLPEIVQQSLDIVCVTGNDAVHPGQIDTDNPETVEKLFELINVITEYMIALPKRVNGIYSSLPQDKIKGIEDRDKQ